MHAVREGKPNVRRLLSRIVATDLGCWEKRLWLVIT